MRPSDLKLFRRLLLFRAKVTRMGNKVHIIIPKAYHSDAEYFKNRYTIVRVGDLPAEVLRTAGAQPSRKTLKFGAKVTRMGNKVHIIIPKAYHSDAEYFKNRYADVSIVDSLFKTLRVIHQATVLLK
jgi:putative transposon-encoded protein